MEKKEVIEIKKDDAENQKEDKMKKREVIEIKKDDAENQDEDKMVIELSREYRFEGKTYKELDLRGMEDLTAKDMIDANRVLSRSGNVDFMQELSLEYACVIASKGAGLPIEFFKGLQPKDAMKVKNRVTGFLYGTE